MADINLKYGTATAFTVTNANLASSATAGWVSNAIDNTANLYIDALVQFRFGAVNTAPANSKAIICFAFALVDPAGTDYTNTGAASPSGSEGTLTYPDVTTLPCVAPLLGIVPYPVQNIALKSAAFSVAACFGGILPPKWCVGYVNHTGMTLTGSDHDYIEIERTVA